MSISELPVDIQRLITREYLRASSGYSTVNYSEYQRASSGYTTVNYGLTNDVFYKFIRAVCYYGLNIETLYT
jgi:hypothetical protein